MTVAGKTPAGLGEGRPFVTRATHHLHHKGCPPLLLPACLPVLAISHLMTFLLVAEVVLAERKRAVPGGRGVLGLCLPSSQAWLLLLSALCLGFWQYEGPACLW